MASDGIPDGYYRDGILTKTEFRDNGFGIDPEGCGCTDCLIGQAFHPSDETRLWTAIRQGRPLYNRTGHEVLLPNGIRLPDDAVWRPNTTQFVTIHPTSMYVRCPHCYREFPL